MNAPPIPSLLLASVVLASCTSTSFTERPLLPFHVAVIPIDVNGRPLAAPDAYVRSDQEPEEHLSVALDLDGQRPTARLVEALRRNFVEVTVLSGGADGWVEEAKGSEADLIIEAKLEYEPEMYSSLNKRFTYNLPLFLLGGPACWFVADRDYFVDNNLQVDLYDLSVLGERSKDYGGARIGDRIALIGDSTSTVKEASLGFNERGLNKPLSLVSSLVIPAGFLAKSNDTVKENLGERIMDELFEDASGALYASARNHLLHSKLFDFSPVIVHDVEGIHISMKLEGEEITALSRYQLGSDPERNFDEARDGKYRVKIEDVPADGRLRVRVIDASSRQNERTFTLRSQDGRLSGATAEFK